MYFLGDFNSVTDPVNHHSGRCDHTTELLWSIIAKGSLVEPSGNQIFSYTYQHPSISSCKSRIDRIYINDHFIDLHGFTHSFSFSDHYGVGIFICDVTPQGAQPWQFPLDLSSQENVHHIQFILSTFHPDSAIASWEKIKDSLQTNTRKTVAF